MLGCVAGVWDVVWVEEEAEWEDDGEEVEVNGAEGVEWEEVVERVEVWLVDGRVGCWEDKLELAGTVAVIVLAENLLSKACASWSSRSQFIEEENIWLISSMSLFCGRFCGWTSSWFNCCWCKPEAVAPSIVPKNQSASQERASTIDKNT